MLTYIWGSLASGEVVWMFHYTLLNDRCEVVGYGICVRRRGLPQNCSKEISKLQNAFVYHVWVEKKSVNSCFVHHIKGHCNAVERGSPWRAPCGALGVPYHGSSHHRVKNLFCGFRCCLSVEKQYMAASLCTKPIYNDVSCVFSHYSREWVTLWTSYGLSKLAVSAMRSPSNSM